MSPNTVSSPPISPPMPKAVQSGRTLLLLVFVVAAIGAANVGLHILRARGVESSDELAADLMVLVRRAAAFVIAGASLWAISRRKPAARWLTAGVFFFLALWMLAGFWGAMQPSMLGARFVQPHYQTGGEVVGGLLVVVPVVAVLSLVGIRLIRSDQVREYFGTHATRHETEP
jgi:hypothetical protein